jgi:hypothetical protein
MWGQPPSAVLRAQLEAFRCRQQSLAFTRALTIRPRSARILKAVRNGQLVVSPKTVGLWRSWERAPALPGRSSVRVVFLKWACGAAGSALPWHGRGRRFDPDQVHHLYNMPAVYVLQSKHNKRFYIGCAEQPEVRLAEHQRGQTISTRGRGPWTLV